MAKNQRDIEKEAFWRGVLNRRAASGLSVRVFCRQEKLTESAFYAWRRTIGARDGKSAKPIKAPPTFVPAVMTSEPLREASLVIELAGGRALRLPESIAAARLAELVEALEGRGEP